MLNINCTWEVPEFCHVVSLKDLALIGSSVAVKSKTYTAVTFVFVSKSKSGTERDLKNHN